VTGFYVKWRSKVEEKGGRYAYYYSFIPKVEQLGKVVLGECRRGGTKSQREKELGRGNEKSAGEQRRTNALLEVEEQYFPVQTLGTQTRKKIEKE